MSRFDRSFRFPHLSARVKSHHTILTYSYCFPVRTKYEPFNKSRARSPFFVFENSLTVCLSCVNSTYYVYNENSKVSIDRKTGLHGKIFLHVIS